MRPLAALLLAAAGVVFAPGARLHVEPDVRSLSVAVVDEETELEPLDFRDGWFLVRYLGVSGWVREGKPYSLGRERGDAALPAQRLDEELVGRWRARLAPPVREIRLGPVTVVTDVADPAMERDLVARSAYARARLSERLGFGTFDEPGPALVLFARPADAPPDGDRACGRSQGRVALAAAGAESCDGTVDRVLHQVGHLLAFESFGSGLPPWLEEGLACALVEASRSKPAIGNMLAPMDQFWASAATCPPADAGLEALFASGPELFLDEPSAACLRRDAADLVRFLSDAPISYRPWRFRRYFYDVARRDAPFDVPTLLDYLNEDLPSLGRKLRSAQLRHRGAAGPSDSGAP